ncbi:MAG: class I SAM-dependent methyltransferase [Candidatus Cloacimonetes bacterium]|nr:class I SAM-dependent methyltransferase [Candidatus Cloacimonadota bacterium]
MPDALPKAGAPIGDRRWLTPWLRSLVHKRLQGLQEGRLRVVEDGTVQEFGRQGPVIQVHVHDGLLWNRLALGGGTGAADAWSEGLWDSPDLVGLVRLLVRNRATLEGLDSGAARIAQWLGRLAHRLRRNTPAGSRENIAAHYDLGNDFYRLFLDDSLSYSAAVWAHPTDSLEEAQKEKIDRLCRHLDLQPGHNLLEIGTGWGALALHAAREYGCRVTTTTISTEQAAHARAAVRQARLEDRIEVIELDYRKLEGQYDRLVSVEMIEAVGHEYLAGFISTCSALLKPDGLMALQAITYPDRHYEGYRRRADFIQRRIFPGSCLVSLAHLYRQLGEVSDLRPVLLEDITEHYATTLAAWRVKLLANRTQALALGYGESFLRLWEYYLAYCEGGFREHFIGDVQLILAKPEARPRPGHTGGAWA